MSRLVCETVSSQGDGLCVEVMVAEGEKVKSWSSLNKGDRLDLHPYGPNSLYSEYTKVKLSSLVSVENS